MRSKCLAVFSCCPSFPSMGITSARICEADESSAWLELSRPHSTWKWLNWNSPQMLKSSSHLWWDNKRENIVEWCPLNSSISKMSIFHWCNTRLGFLKPRDYWHFGPNHSLCGDCPVHCKTLSSFLGLYSLDASSTVPPSRLQHPKMSPDFVSCPLGSKSGPFENFALASQGVRPLNLKWAVPSSTPLWKQTPGLRMFFGQGLFYSSAGAIPGPEALEGLVGWRDKPILSSMPRVHHRHI